MDVLAALVVMLPADDYATETKRWTLNRHVRLGSCREDIRSLNTSARIQWLQKC